MSEHQADEAAAEPTDTGSETPEDSTGSSDSNESTDSGDSSKDPGPSEPGEISDADLPEDLQATEDNPLARHPRQTGDEDDKIGADTETGDAANPSASMTYGEDDDEESSSDDAPGESDNAQAKAEEDDGSDSLENGGGGQG